MEAKKGAKSGGKSGIFVILAVLVCAAVLGISAEVAVADASLVGWWRFDEGSGDIAYDSAGDNNGTLVNGPVWTGGRIGGALSFDGVDDYVELGTIGGTDDLALAGSNFTICSWIKPSLTGDTYQRIVDKSNGGNGTNGYGFLVHPNGEIGIVVAGNIYFRSDGSVITAGIWQHVAVTGDGSAYQLYVDGLPVSGSFDPPAPYKSPPSVSTNMRIGTWNHSTAREFNGSIDDIRIYDRALSAEEILQLYREGLGSNVWVQTNGPDGGIINTIEIDPDNPETLYAGGAGGGVFKSTDGGDTWTMLEEIVPPSEQIYDILLKPGDPQTIYAHTHRLYKSTNGGLSWQLAENLGMVGCCAISPGVMLIGRHDGRVYRSTKDGANWTNISSNLPGDRIADIAIGASNEYWAGTANGSDGHLYHTINGGASWNKMNIGQQVDTDIHTIFVDPDDNNVIYVGLIDVHNEMFDPWNDKYLFKTTNGGTTWARLRLPFTDAMINVMGRAPTDNALYVGTGGHRPVYRSTNGGQNWTYIGPTGKSGDMYDIAVDPTDSDILYLPRRAHGIYKSYNRGGRWSLINKGLMNIAISLLAVPSVPGSGTVYASATSGEGTFKTIDWGNSWTNVTEGGMHPWADELVVSPHDPETVWHVGDVAEVSQTTTGGTNWNKIIDPRIFGKGFRFGSVHALAPAPSNPDIIYALKSGFGIFKSDNFGNSWRFLHQSEIDYTYSIAVHPTNPDIVYSGYNPKPFQDFAMVRKTSDGGDSWVTSLNVPNSNGITSVAIDPTNPNTIYAGSIGQPGEIYKSNNEGNSWSQLNRNFIMCTVWGQPQLIINPDNPLIAYTGTWLAGTWKTTNAGQTWTLLENAPVSATSLSMDASDTDVIYLSDRTSPKVWKTTDAGSTWQVTADFYSDRAFLVNRVFADGHTVYAATFGPSLHGGKLYKSTDAGETWSDITGTLPRSVLDVAVHPTNKNILYVTTHIHGAYKSTNGGMSWTEMSDFPDIGAYDIEVDPVNPTILYTCGLGGSVPDWCMKPNGYIFGDEPGVYKSTDYGSTWTKILTTSNECRAIRLHPDNHNMLFAVAMDDGLQVTTNGGSSWSSYNTGLVTRVLTSCAVGGNKIYAGSQACGVHSGDINTGTGAVTWQSNRSNKPVPEVYSLEIKVDPTNSNRIFAGANPGGLYRSDDGGATFYDKNFLTPSVVVDDPFRQGYYTFAINPDDTDEVWIGTWGKGIYKSYDGMDFNIDAHGSSMEMWGKYINQIVIDSGRVYVATEDGVFKTGDGNRWRDFSRGLGTRQIRTLTITANERLLCGTLGYELYSCSTSEWRQMEAFDNFGTFWPIWNDRPLYQYTSLLFHPTDPNIIYFGTFPAGIYKSTDKGQSWLESNVGWTNDGVFCLVFHPEDSNIIYAGTYNGVNRSLDGGAHWEMWDNGWPGEQWVFSIDFDPRDPNVIYACSKNGENEGTGRWGFHGTVMKSINGGETWFAITNGLDINQEFYKIIVDKHDPDILYLATQWNGVFISRNGGISWTAWNEGLTNTVAATNGNNVTNTMVMSADGLFLYFGTAGSGVFRRAKSAPVACIVGGERVVGAGAECEGRVVLDGSCSSDADSTEGTNDDINDFDWYDVIDACEPNSDIYLGSGEVIECNLGLGEHLIILEVTDKAGAFDSNEVVITVEDVTPPEFSLFVEPSVLWPPNHRMVRIEVSWEVSDDCDEEVEVSLVGVTSSEEEDGRGDGRTKNDIIIGDDGSIYLRAERSGKGTGRVYTITYQAVDDSGNVSEASTTVTVPHSRGHRKLRERLRMRKRLYITEDGKAAEWRKQVQK